MNAALNGRAKAPDLDLPELDLREHIRGIADFPKPGIFFYDISTLLGHAGAWRVAVSRLAALIRPYQPTILAGIESRGFLVAAPLALALGLGFVMLRKPRKLPGATIGLDYALEYGSDRIEMQADAVPAGSRVVLLDDLLATGGTMTLTVSVDPLTLRGEERTFFFQVVDLLDEYAVNHPLTTGPTA